MYLDPCHLEVRLIAIIRYSISVSKTELNKYVDQYLYFDYWKGWLIVIDHRWRQNVVRTTFWRLLNWRRATWNLFVLYNNEEKALFISKSFVISQPLRGLCSLWRTWKKPFDIYLLSIQNEAISLVALRSNELWLVQENYATVKLDDSSVASRGMKTYSKSRIELWNLQILKKILIKPSQFLSSEHPCEPKSVEVALNFAGVEQIRSENLWLQSTWGPFNSSFEWRERYWR